MSKTAETYELPSYKTHDPRGWGGDPRRGAATGRRPIHGPRDFDGKLVLRNIPINDDGYDPLGTYWGYVEGEHLYWFAGFDENNDQFEGTCRASSREHAKNQVLKLYPKARFYR